MGTSLDGLSGGGGAVNIQDLYNNLHAFTFDL